MIGGQGTWSAVLGPAGASNPGYWTTGDQTLPGGAKTFTGGPWTFTRTAVASSGETIATFKTSDDSVAKIELKNDTSTDNFFLPSIYCTGPTTNRCVTFYGRATTDTGTAPVMSFDAATAAGAAIATRPLFAWYNNATLNAMLSASGVFRLGGTSSTLIARGGQKIETNATAAAAGAAISTWSADGTGCLVDLNKSRSNTIGTHAIVSSGDDIARISFRASDGSNFIPAADIFAEVDGTPGTNDMPGRLMFLTTADGASATTERMRITSGGDVGIGKTPTTGVILDLNGPLGLKSYTVGTMPSAATQQGIAIWVSDAAGSPCAALSNGTNWKRCDDMATTVS